MESGLTFDGPWRDRTSDLGIKSHSRAVTACPAPSENLLPVQDHGPPRAAVMPPYGAPSGSVRLQIGLQTPRRCAEPASAKCARPHPELPGPRMEVGLIVLGAVLALAGGS